jgi:hopene-associated glycosyltransferase HpnB
MSVLLAFAALALLAWAGVLLAPHQAHRVREHLDADLAAPDDLGEVSVLIPARDEAETIGRTLAALAAQGRDLDVVVIDDQSADGTAKVAAVAVAAQESFRLRVLSGQPLPPGWAGKLWALEQGLHVVDRPFVLLLDADIELAPDMLPTLLLAARQREASLVSIMAELHCATFWEKLLTPAFIFFFKLLYPFAWSNDPERRTAAAAGGCMLVRTAVLRDVGGFAAIRGALIDDCTLAAALKRRRPPIWLGVSRSVRSLRVYAELRDFWSMVSRSAFTQLRYSSVLLFVTTALMLAVLLVPVVAVATGVLAGVWQLAGLGMLAWLAMSVAYWPVVHFYRLPAGWALTLPVAAALFLAMTWSSAAGYWCGTRASWKSRRYGTTPAERR